jgi:hypothetical protein
VLDIALVGADDLLDFQSMGYMAREQQSLAACLLRHRKERIARRMILDLDQIHALALEQLNRGLPSWSSSRVFEQPVSWRIVENRPRERSDESASPLGSIRRLHRRIPGLEHHHTCAELSQ